MRSVSIFLALAMVMAATLAFLPKPAQAAGTPKLSIWVEAGAGGGQFVFVPSTIVLPQVPIILNVTLFNNGTIGLHTFSIQDTAGTERVNIETAAHGDRASVEFTVSSITQIAIGTQQFQPQASSDGGIKFYCRPHVDLGMVGSIVVGGAAQKPSPEIGVFLRAYWIGLIGLAAMLVWTGIAYFIIKSSSRHLRDHHDHIRRGLT